MDQCRPGRVPIKLQAGVNNYFSTPARGIFLRKSTTWNLLIVVTRPERQLAGIYRQHDKTVNGLSLFGGPDQAAHKIQQRAGLGGHVVPRRVIRV